MEERLFGTRKNGRGRRIVFLGFRFRAGTVGSFPCGFQVGGAFQIRKIELRFEIGDFPHEGAASDFRKLELDGVAFGSETFPKRKGDVQAGLYRPSVGFVRKIHAEFDRGLRPVGLQLKNETVFPSEIGVPIFRASAFGIEKHSERFDEVEQERADIAKFPFDRSFRNFRGDVQYGFRMVFGKIGVFGKNGEKFGAHPHDLRRPKACRRFRMDAV